MPEVPGGRVRSDRQPPQGISHHSSGTHPEMSGLMKREKQKGKTGHETNHARDVQGFGSGMMDRLR